MVTFEDALAAYEEGLVGENYREKVDEIRQAFTKCVGILHKLDQECIVSAEDLPSSSEVMDYDLPKLSDLLSKLHRDYFVDEFTMDAFPYSWIISPLESHEKVEMALPSPYF